MQSKVGQSMKLVDIDKLDDTIVRLNQDGWDITRNEYKRIADVLFEMPTEKAVPIKELEIIRSKLENIVLISDNDSYIKGWSLGIGEAIKLINKCIGDME